MCAIMGFTSPTLKEETMRPFFDRTLSRGPDQTRVEPAGKGWLCFHRLAIMGLSEEGMQPFHLGGDMVVCNGEIYGFRKLRAQRSIPSAVSPTARSCCRSTASTGWRCLKCSTRSLR